MCLNHFILSYKLTLGDRWRRAMDMSYHNLGSVHDQIVQRPQQGAPPVADLFGHRDEHLVLGRGRRAPLVQLVLQGARRRGGGAAPCAPQRLPRLVLSDAPLLHLLAASL